MRKLLTLLVLLFLAATSFGSTVLVYDGGGFEPGVQDALTALGIPFDLRDAGNPVTAPDLASHDILVVGWNSVGDMSGLSPFILEAGITGNVIVTGHDADWHSVHGFDSGSGGDAVAAAATAFLSQAMAFGEAGGGTGLLAFADPVTLWSYLPSSWGITGVAQAGDTVSSFTAAGLASGVYAGLTPADMSNWANSFHSYFDTFGDFDAFELAPSWLTTDGVDFDTVTIGRGTVVPEPASIMSLFAGLALLGGYSLRRKQ